jgi:ATP-dependent DNA helicase RecQ
MAPSRDSKRGWRYLLAAHALSITTMRKTVDEALAGGDAALPDDPCALTAFVQELAERELSEISGDPGLHASRRLLQALRGHYRLDPSAFTPRAIENLRSLAKRIESRPPPSSDIVFEILKKDFGYSSFRPGQQPVIEAILQGRDAIAILPTGGGKSLCYQLPARIVGGLTLVVSPLIALMKDQVDALLEVGISAAFLNSTLCAEARRETVEGLLAGRFQLLYAAPEGLDASVGTLLGRLPIRLVAVDEAHCISHWGHDFRPTYRQLQGLKRRFGDVPILALTATAPRQVVDDIAEQLRMVSPYIHRGSFFRPNLKLFALQKGPTLGTTTKEAVARFVRARRGQSGIVYCLSRKNTETTAAWLQKFGIRAAAYHAGLPMEERTRVQNAYRDDDVDVVVATIAFGMGIDKSNVRYVVHQDMPRSIEGYMQEIGRAGRDGLTSECVVFYSWSDVLAYDRIAEGQQDENAMARLQAQARAMFAFASSERCRHQSLVAYFDEVIADCGTACDRCDPRPLFDSKREPRSQVTPGIPRAKRQLRSDNEVDEVQRPSRGNEVINGAVMARFERLKALRLVLARQKQVPAYVVFTDATLLAMAEQKPNCLDELEDVPGVGQKKLNAYGEQFVALLRTLD